MRASRVLIFVAILLLGALAAVVLVRFGPRVERVPEPPQPPAVRVLEVRPRDVQVWIESQGEAQPRTRTALVAQVPGRIVKVSPQYAEGAFFERGDPLVWIDPSDYKLALEQANVRVAEARVALEQERAEAEVAREEWAQLGRGKANALVLRKPQVAQAEAALEAARAGVKQAKLQLSRTVIEAPYDGRVQAIQADLGQYVNAAGELAAIYATDYAEVSLPIEERDFRFLSVGPGYPGNIHEGPTVVLSNGYADRPGTEDTWHGRIVRVGGTVDPRTRLINVYARVVDPFNRTGAPDRPPLPMGTFVQARIEGRLLQDVFVLPRTALRDGRILVVENGRIAYREAAPLRVRGDDVILPRELLEPGAQVVVSALETPVEGMAVRPVPVDPRAMAGGGA